LTADADEGCRVDALINACSDRSSLPKPTEHALSDISLARLKISRLSDLNDPFELAAVSTWLQEHAAGAA
jgi:hypothetical protein